MTHPTHVMFASGHNNIGGLALLPTIKGYTDAPLMPGFYYSANRYAFNRLRQDDGRYTWLQYPKLRPANFQTLNSYFGFNPLGGVNSIASTWNIKYDDGVWHYWNGTIQYAVLGNPTQRTFASWMSAKYMITALEDLGV